jgi:charged multivesicular body protein 4A/B
LQSVDGTLTTLEYQRENLENSHTTKEIIQVMSEAAEASKLAHSLDPDEVHDMMDEISEQNEMSKELTDMVSSGFGLHDAFSEVILKIIVTTLK